MEDISLIRQEIDNIDKELTQLFERRMAISKDVAEYKRANGLPVLNLKREEEVIQKAINSLENKVFAPYVSELYTHIMELSKRYQKLLGSSEISIGFQGVEGSFSHEACTWYINSRTEEIFDHPKAYDTFDKLCLALLNDEISRAVIPFENSSTGAVIDVYDLLLSYDYYIAGEVCIRVNHNLMAREGVELSEIREVYSHPQAFMQSKEFLDKFSFKQIPYKNTAISARFVSTSDRRDIACIAGEQAAKLYGLKILEHNINYNKNNYTKFIVLSKTPVSDCESDKISMVVKLENTPGQLHNLTSLFAKHSINMIKIESRPDVTNPFEYIFFIDIIGSVSDDNVKLAIDEVKASTKGFKYLGNYKKFDF